MVIYFHIMLIHICIFFCVIVVSFYDIYLYYVYITLFDVFVYFGNVLCLLILLCVFVDVLPQILVLKCVVNDVSLVQLHVFSCDEQLYRNPCPSVRLSVRLSVCLLVCDTKMSTKMSYLGKILKKKKLQIFFSNFFFQIFIFLKRNIFLLLLFNVPQPNRPYLRRKKK